MCSSDFVYWALASLSSPQSKYSICELNRVTGVLESFPRQEIIVEGPSEISTPYHVALHRCSRHPLLLIFIHKVAEVKTMDPSLMYFNAFIFTIYALKG